MLGDKDFICTSLNNCKGGDYCKECHHGIFRHEIKIKSKTYRFELKGGFFTFLKKDGEPSKMMLNEKHPFWKEFDKWHDNKFKKAGNDN